MKRKQWIMISLGALVLAIGAFLLIAPGGKSKETGPKALLPPRVTVSPVREGTVQESIWVTGEVNALYEVEIASKIPGRLIQLTREDGTPIQEGVWVEAGQVVARIEDDQYRAAFRSAEATLVVANSSRGTAEVNLAEGIREKERWEKLRREDSGSEQELDRAVTALDRAQAELVAAEARIAQAEAGLEQARVNLAETVIRAPFSGVVSCKYLDEGAFVSPGTPLFRLSDISGVEITGGVADRHLAKLVIGETRAQIEVDAFPEEVFTGMISRIRPQLDRVTRTVSVTIHADNSNQLLKPGMYARIQLIIQERIGVPLISDEAILISGDESRIFVVEGGIAHSRLLQLGLREANQNEVLSGVTAGEQVVIRGQRRLQDGMEVEAMEVNGR